MIVLPSSVIIRNSMTVLSALECNSGLLSCLEVRRVGNNDETQGILVGRVLLYILFQGDILYSCLPLYICYLLASEMSWKQ